MRSVTVPGSGSVARLAEPIDVHSVHQQEGGKRRYRHSLVAVDKRVVLDQAAEETGAFGQDGRVEPAAGEPLIRLCQRRAEDARVPDFEGRHAV